MSSSTEDSFRRHFVAIATSEYEGPHWSALPGVSAEVDEISRWLTSEVLGSRRFTPRFPELASNPTLNQIRARLEAPDAQDRFTDGDAAIVFVTGHGIVHENTHWIVLKSSNESRLRSTALRSSDLIGWLAEADVGRAMIILDLCHAGKTAADVADFARTIPPNWLLLASASASEEANTGALTEAITSFLATLRSPEGQGFGLGPYLRVDHFLEAVQEKLGKSQQLVRLNSHEFGPSPLLPNPWHRPELSTSVTEVRRELSLRPEDVLAHWGPRSRGVASEGQAGWLFTGRARLMREIVGITTAAPGTTVISGAAGSGKSTVLARLVTLSDESFCETYAAEVSSVPVDLRPAVGAVDAAILATGKYPRDVLVQLLEALGAPESGKREGGVEHHVTRWEEFTAAASFAPTVVVDAIDESEDPIGLIRLLARLMGGEGAPPMRLLIGVRSPGGAGKTEQSDYASSLADQAAALLGARRLRVDVEPWWDPADIADFAVATLLAQDESPYARAETIRVRELGAAIAAAAGRSFLIARMAAAALASRNTVVDTSDTTWLSAVRDGVIGVFRDDLFHSFHQGKERTRAVHLLRATAFAYGRGLPWRGVWPPIASAIDLDSGVLYGDSDIAWLLESRLGAYLLTDVADGVTVYRPFHDMLRATLRDEWRQLVGEGQSTTPSGETRLVEGIIAQALRRLTPIRVIGGTRLPPTPYVRRHLADHAHAAGMLTRNVLSDSFLPYVDLSRLRALLSPATPDPQMTALSTVLRKVTRFWDWDRPDTNAAALELWGALEGLSPPLRGTGGPWRIVWAVSDDHSELLWHARHPARGVLQVVRQRSRNLALIADGGRLDMLDLTSGERIGENADKRRSVWSPIVAIHSTVDHRGHGVAVGVHSSGLVRGWNLSTGSELSRFHLEERKADDEKSTISLVETPAGMLVVVTRQPAMSATGGVFVYELQTGVERWSWRTDRGIVSAVPATSASGWTPSVVVGADDGWVCALDCVTGTQLADAHWPEGIAQISADFGRDGRLWVVGLLANGDVLLSAFTSEVTTLAGKPLTSGALGLRVSQLANGDAGCLVRDVNGGLTLFDIATCQRIGQRIVPTARSRERHPPGNGLVPTTRSRTSRAIEAVFGRDGRPIIVAAVNDVVHAWDAWTAEAVGPPGRGHLLPIEAIETSLLDDGRVVAITDSGDATVRAWTIGGSTAESESTVSAGEPILALGVITLHGKQVVATAQAGVGSYAIRAHDLTDGRTLDLEILGKGALSAAGFVNDSSSAAIAVVAERTGNLRFFDLATASPINLHRFAHPSPTTAIETGMFNGRVFCVTGSSGGSLRSWDCLTGEPLGERHNLHDDQIQHIRLLELPMGDVVALSGGRDHRLWLTDAVTLQPRGRAIGSHSAPITSLDVAVAAGRPLAVVGGDDGCVRLWDITESAPLTAPVRAHHGRVTSVKIIHPVDAESVVITTGVDSTVQMFSFSSLSRLADPLVSPGLVFAIAADSAKASKVVLGGEVLAVVEPALAH
jgi:WD40 repeat protein